MLWYLWQVSSSFKFFSPVWSLSPQNPKTPHHPLPSHQIPSNPPFRSTPVTARRQEDNILSASRHIVLKTLLNDNMRWALRPEPRLTLFRPSSSQTRLIGALCKYFRRRRSQAPLRHTRWRRKIRNSGRTSPVSSACLFCRPIFRFVIIKGTNRWMHMVWCLINALELR